MEKGSWSEFADLFATADLICDDKEDLTWAHLCNSAGCVEYERGNPQRSRPWMETSLRIRERLLPEDDQELSDAYNNFANLLLTESQTPESLDQALLLYLKAAAIDDKYPDGGHVLHIRYLNIGIAYTWQGRYDQAYKAYETGRRCAIKTFGPECHFEGR
jgi:tetratricopeptide (TPR) repeat protein